MRPSEKERIGEEAFLLEAAMRHVDEAVLITTTELDHPGPEIVYVNEGFCRMTGYTPDEVIGRTPRLLQGPKTDRAPVDRLRRLLSRGEPFDGRNVINYRKDGSEYVLEWYIEAIRDSDGKITHWISSQRDVTELKAMEERLRHQALHDPLTGLPNRTLFAQRLELALSRARMQEEPGALLFLDLDGFKDVNDSLGHEAGDKLLVEAAERLMALLTPGATVARFGGDEFAVLLEHPSDEAEAMRVAERIVGTLGEPFVLAEREASISASIGIVALSASSGGSEELLRDADVAMYRAKEEGKGRYRVFEEAMRVRILQRLRLEDELRRAIQQEEFALHYQPKVKLPTGKIVGFEALVRWRHPERGMLPPSAFVPLAEETGLIVPIGLRVLGEACRRAKEWQERFPGVPPLVMCVNLSARQLRDPELVSDVARVLEETGLDPASLDLEITESVLVRDTEASVVVLDRLRGLGLNLIVDDFGTEYSSLSYLKRLPVNFLKIDRSFVAGIDKDAKDEAIVSSVVGLASSLGMAAIAEGVESAGQAVRLHELGCGLAQGFYFGKPRPAEEVLQWLADGRATTKRSSDD